MVVLPTTRNWDLSEDDGDPVSDSWNGQEELTVNIAEDTEYTFRIQPDSTSILNGTEAVFLALQEPAGDDIEPHGWSLMETIAGPARESWHYFAGTGTPDGDEGERGDWGLTGFQLIYEKTDDDVWSFVDTYTFGTWHSGTTVPAGNLGADGEYYLHTPLGDVYRKASGAWELIDNLGRIGSQIRSTNTTLNDSDGDDDDWNFNKTTGQLSDKVAGAWVDRNSLGDALGGSWLTGFGEPLRSSGNNGDAYFDRVDGGVIVKKDRFWNFDHFESGPLAETTGATINLGRLNPLTMIIYACTGEATGSRLTKWEADENSFSEWEAFAYPRGVGVAFRERENVPTPNPPVATSLLDPFPPNTVRTWNPETVNSTWYSTGIIDAEGDGAEWEWQAWIRLDTLLPGPLQNVRITTVGETTALISYNLPLTGGEVEKVQYQNPFGGSTAWMDLGDLSGEIYLINLSAETTYELPLRPVNLIGAGPVSRITFTTTSAAATDPPPTPTITRVSNTQLKFVRGGEGATRYHAQHHFDHTRPTTGFSNDQYIDVDANEHDTTEYLIDIPAGVNSRCLHARVRGENDVGFSTYNSTAFTQDGTAAPSTGVFWDYDQEAYVTNGSGGFPSAVTESNDELTFAFDRDSFVSGLPRNGIETSYRTDPSSTDFTDHDSVDDLCTVNGINGEVTFPDNAVSMLMRTVNGNNEQELRYETMPAQPVFQPLAGGSGVFDVLGVPRISCDMSRPNTGGRVLLAEVQARIIVLDVGAGPETYDDDLRVDFNVTKQLYVAQYVNSHLRFFDFPFTSSEASQVFPDDPTGIISLFRIRFKGTQEWSSWSRVYRYSTGQVSTVDIPGDINGP